MYKKLKEINAKPKVFEFYTAEALWADEYTSKQMLEYHLNPDIDVSSRNKKFIEKSSQWIMEEFKLNAKSRICDFGCAVGLYTSVFVKSGAKVTGIDFSKSSIEYAREVAKKEKLKIEYVHQNYLEFESDEKYDLITMIMCDFCALSPTQRELLLRKFYNLLNEGGAILLDVYSLNAFEKREESSVYELNQLGHFWSAEEYYGFVNTFKYSDEKVVLDKYTIVQEDSSKVIYNWLQYFNVESLQKEFTDAGLHVKAVYNDVAGSVFTQDSEEFAVVAVKK
ncbi:MAG: class I SAM-dependent methyltransferase [Campylobacterota bacterium]|nr:class I SAM-dependent methyltransferase [Campylobacterota bacterium]